MFKLESNNQYRVNPVLNPDSREYIYIRHVNGNHYEAMIPKDNIDSSTGAKASNAIRLYFVSVAVASCMPYKSENSCCSLSSGIKCWYW